MDDNKNETKMTATAPSVGSFNADISESNLSAGCVRVPTISLISAESFQL